MLIPVQIMQRLDALVAAAAAQLRAADVEVGAGGVRVLVHLVHEARHALGAARVALGALEQPPDERSRELVDRLEGAAAVSPPTSRESHDPVDEVVPLLFGGWLPAGPFSCSSGVSLCWPSNAQRLSGSAQRPAWSGRGSGSRRPCAGTPAAALCRGRRPRGIRGRARARPRHGRRGSRGSAAVSSNETTRPGTPAPPRRRPLGGSSAPGRARRTPAVASPCISSTHPSRSYWEDAAACENGGGASPMRSRGCFG